MKKVVFDGGHAWGADGRPLSYWICIVQYKWDATHKMFSVYVEETLGTGSVYNSHSYEEEMKTCKEINDFLHIMKETETHYKKVYGE